MKELWYISIGLIAVAIIIGLCLFVGYILVPVFPQIIEPIPQPAILYYGIMGCMFILFIGSISYGLMLFGKSIINIKNGEGR